MKYLNKFARYLSESNEISIEDVKEFIIPFQDMGLECDITNSEMITSGKFIGRKCRKIIIDISRLEKDVYGSIIDQNIWEILDELITLKNRLESEGVFLCIGHQDIFVTFLEKDEIDSDLAELIRLYRVISEQLITKLKKIDSLITLKPFIYLDDRKIVVVMETRWPKELVFAIENWNSMIRDIDDFSKFNITKDIKYGQVIFTIVPKKKLK